MKTIEMSSPTRNSTAAANAELPYFAPKVALRVAATGMPTPVASMRLEKTTWFAIR
jgi:hypothetical protein